MNFDDLNDYELISLARTNEEVNEYIYQKYAPLIKKMAKKYYLTNKNVGIELGDMIQEGNIALSNAIETYREDSNILFFTYASACINRGLISYAVTLNRQKHRFLNDSVSIEAYAEKNLTNILENSSQNPASDPINILIAIEDKKINYEVLKPKLTEFEQTVLELRDYGFNYKDIALLLSKDEKAVDNAMQRIKLKAKQIK